MPLDDSTNARARLAVLTILGSLIAGTGAYYALRPGAAPTHCYVDWDAGPTPGVVYQTLVGNARISTAALKLARCDSPRDAGAEWARFAVAVPMGDGGQVAAPELGADYSVIIESETLVDAAPAHALELWVAGDPADPSPCRCPATAGGCAAVDGGVLAHEQVYAASEVAGVGCLPTSCYDRDPRRDSQGNLHTGSIPEACR